MKGQEGEGRKRQSGEADRKIEETPQKVKKVCYRYKPVEMGKKEKKQRKKSIAHPPCEKKEHTRKGWGRKREAKSVELIGGEKENSGRSMDYGEKNGQ